MSSDPKSLRLPRPSPLLIAVAVVSAAVLGLLAVRFIDLAALKSLLTGLITTLRDAGPLVFFSAMALLPAFGMPLMPFALAAGPVFGPTLGTVTVIACATLAIAFNITLSYWLADRGLRPMVIRITTRLGYTLPQLHAHTAWQWIILARLAPGVPFCVQSYLLGLARAPLAPYIVVSVLIPMSYLSAAILGLDALLEGRTRTALIVLAALGLLALAVRIWQKRRVTFRSSPAALDTGVPVLAVATDSALFPRAQLLPSHGLFQLHRHGDWLLGSARVPVNADIESATHQLYRDLVTAIGDHQLCRIWNYVPAINAPGPGGEENYRLFCRARSQIFDDAFGPNLTARIPAASAVGTDGDHLCILFAAHRATPRHVENPQQIPAYDYPSDYGPRAPSFARATVLADTVFISGTSSIRGHATVFPHDTAAQLACTLDNLRIITTEARASSTAARHITVYLRHAADLPAVTAALNREFLSPTDRVTYLRADICRAELNIEIEITFLPS